MKKVLIFALAGILSTSPAFAYDISNHFDMSKEAAKRSVLQTDPNVLLNLGLRSWGDADQKFSATEGENSTELTDGCEHAIRFSILDLIGCGAQFEDVPGTRSVNHFYDPTNNGPLKVRVPPLIGPWVTPGISSPDWALKDNNDSSAQAFSYKDARNYFYQALTTGPQQDRDALWGKLFQSIGQVIHHVQDMAQPQHVRNDAHMDKLWLLPYYNPSLYESYTGDQNNRPVVQALLSSPGSEPVYTSNNPGSFNTPRDFWINAQHTGLAEFTNRNFVSAGTNFELYQGLQ